MHGTNKNAAVRRMDRQLVRRHEMQYEYGVPAGGATCFECWFVDNKDVPAIWTAYRTAWDTTRYLCDKHFCEVRYER